MAKLFEVVRVSGSGLVGSGVSLSTALVHQEEENRKAAYRNNLALVKDLFTRGRRLPTEDGMKMLRAAAEKAERISAFTMLAQIKQEIADRSFVGDRLAEAIREEFGLDRPPVKTKKTVSIGDEKSELAYKANLARLEAKEKERQIELAWVQHVSEE